MARENSILLGAYNRLLTYFLALLCSIIPSNGNSTGKLRVRVYARVGSGGVGSGRVGSNFRHGSGTGTGKHHRVRVLVRVAEMLDPHTSSTVHLTWIFPSSPPCRRQSVRGRPSG